ncbi:Hypothetical predicted protein [Scomber scombrus]|uniref:Uncharacterized protein n=1 Tax=Scomber scombrus TaxID=13677 RepID=A0AAV1PXG1_SCOSC
MEKPFHKRLLINQQKAASPSRRQQLKVKTEGNAFEALEEKLLRRLWRRRGPGVRRPDASTLTFQLPFGSVSRCADPPPPLGLCCPNRSFSL